MWVTRTTLTDGFSFRASLIASGSMASPQVAVSLTTDAPYTSANWANLSPKTPMDTDSTTSPGEIVLTTAASMPPVPAVVSIRTSCSVWNTRLRFSVILVLMSRNSGPRWLIIWRPMASKTSSGQGVGPGILRFNSASCNGARCWVRFEGARRVSLHCEF